MQGLTFLSWVRVFIFFWGLLFLLCFFQWENFPWVFYFCVYFFYFYFALASVFCHIRGVFFQGKSVVVRFLLWVGFAWNITGVGLLGGFAGINIFSRGLFKDYDVFRSWCSTLIVNFFCLLMRCLVVLTGFFLELTLGLSRPSSLTAWSLSDRIYITEAEFIIKKGHTRVEFLFFMWSFANRLVFLFFPVYFIIIWLPFFEEPFSWWECWDENYRRYSIFFLPFIFVFLLLADLFYELYEKWCGSVFKEQLSLAIDPLISAELIGLFFRFGAVFFLAFFMWYLAYLSLYLTFFETVIPMFEDPHTLFEFLYFWVDLLLVFFVDLISLPWGILMGTLTRLVSVPKVFSLFNFFFMHKKVFFLIPSSLGLRWVSFFFECGVINAWENFSIFKGQHRIKVYLRYKDTQPLGFFFRYPFSLRKGTFFSLKTLRSFLLIRSGITLFLSTARGFLVGADCVRYRVGGVLVGVLV